jgi:hypothetical protein
VLRRLETAHIQLARKTVMAVKEAVIKKHATRADYPRTSSQMSMPTLGHKGTGVPDVERGEPNQNGSVDNEERMILLIRILAPYVDEFGLSQDNRFVRSAKAVIAKSRWAFRKTHPLRDLEGDMESVSNHATRAHPASSRHPNSKSVWEALLNLPRDTLEPYQPLISLSKLFRGKTVPYVFVCPHPFRSTDQLTSVVQSTISL